MELTKKEYHLLMNALAYYIAFRNPNEKVTDEEIADLSRALMDEMKKKFKENA